VILSYYLTLDKEMFWWGGFQFFSRKLKRTPIFSFDESPVCRYSLSRVMTMTQATIVIIEDDNDNLELVRILLSQAGFINYGAPDGRVGLELIHQYHPDLVLLDLTLPQIDGWHLAKQIKSDPEMASIKVIALTAHTLPGDRKRALEAGCDGYLTKPINIPTFIPEINSYLGKK